jgi:hypothetical protein
MGGYKQELGQLSRIAVITGSFAPEKDALACWSERFLVATINIKSDYCFPSTDSERL